MSPYVRHSLTLDDSTSEPLHWPHLQTITQLLNQIKYGALEIIVQDGKIVQINKMEKIRF